MNCATKKSCNEPDFLLLNDAAKELYAVAAEEPIYDYHCHLAPGDCSGQQWDNLTEVWLAGDHHKWRALRARVSEKYITGDASDYEKFCAFAKQSQNSYVILCGTGATLNSLESLESRVLNQSTAQRIWDEANAQLGKISAQTLLAHFRVAAIGTTDDPCDNLSHHIEISKSELKTRVYLPFVLTRHSPPMTQNFPIMGSAARASSGFSTILTHFLKRSPIATLFSQLGQPTLRPRD